jgi:hypothetical protein
VVRPNIAEHCPSIPIKNNQITTTKSKILEGMKVIKLFNYRLEQVFSTPEI